jgi:peroxiredoxin
MTDKLGINAAFPDMTLTLADGGTLQLPRGLNAKYVVALFYRGHW